MVDPIPTPVSGPAAVTPALPGDHLTLLDFSRLASTVAGYPYIKIVFDRQTGTMHLIDGADSLLHVQYVGERILGMSRAELAAELDSFNDSVYRAPDRRFYLGTLALHRNRSPFLSLETVEVDTMSTDMLLAFYREVRAFVDESVPVLLKPANHAQETAVEQIPVAELPRILAHELFSTSPYVPLHISVATGRLRVFDSITQYQSAEPLRWHDIVVMPKVPEDIPRLSGMVSAEHSSPLSHTNVLAAGWDIPNAVELGAVERFAELDGTWVKLTVDAAAQGVSIVTADRPATIDDGPPWQATSIDIGAPDLSSQQIRPLDTLRIGDRNRFGTKAANLGELCDLMQHGSPRWLGFYQRPRPPRDNLLVYLARQLDLGESADEAALNEGTLNEAALRVVKQHAHVPRGVVLPFALQQRFLRSSPEIRQAIARLKAALELSEPVESICAALTESIRSVRFPEDIRQQIQEAVDRHLAGVSRFVVRSSSNAEDLAGFSAAGIYESVGQVDSIDGIIDSVREVWASLFSARGVRLRQEAGIAAVDCYMGVLIQEQVDVFLGGVLVTCNPVDAGDFRNVYMNMSRSSVADVVEGNREPLQHQYNTMEGGSRTLSLGSEQSDVDADTRQLLHRLAIFSRLLQAHFSPPGNPDAPVDVEWAITGQQIFLLQCRPFRLPR